MRNDENVKIDLLQRRLRRTCPRLYHAVTIAISLCLLIFVYITLRGAIASAQNSWTSGTNLPTLTYGMIHAVIAMSVGLMGIYTLYELVPI